MQLPELSLKPGWQLLQIPAELHDTHDGDGQLTQLLGIVIVDCLKSAVLQLQFGVEKVNPLKQAVHVFDAVPVQPSHPPRQKMH